MTDSTKHEERPYPILSLRSVLLIPHLLLSVEQRTANPDILVSRRDLAFLNNEIDFLIIELFWLLATKDGDTHLDEEESDDSADTVSSKTLKQ